MQIHIAQTINPKSGGEGTAAHGLSRGLSYSSIPVLLITKDITNCKLGSDKANFKIIVLKKYNCLTFIFLDTYRLFSIFKRNKPDIVHIHGLWNPFVTISALICILMKIQFIVSPHGCLEDWALKHKWLKKKVAMFVYQKFILKK